jgi:hypothetical protein
MGIIRYNRGKEIYFRIHQGAFAELVCLIFDRQGAFLRLLTWLAVSILRPSKRSQIGVFWRVLTAPRRAAEG